MASTATILSVVMSLIFLFLHVDALAASRPGIKMSRPDLKDVCSRALDPTSCLNILKSDPQSSRSDLRALAGISIQLAQKSAKEAVNMANSLIKKARNPHLRSRYESCTKSYMDVRVQLGKALKSSNLGDFVGVGRAAMDAIAEVENCEDEFEGPPPELSRLPRENVDLLNHCGVVYAIAKKGAS